MKLGSGYWPSPEPNNVTHLVKCPISSACNPSDSCTCELNTSPKDKNAPSNRPQVLSLFTTCNHSCICHQGNTDRFCSRCLDGFNRLGGLCFRCKNGDLLYYYMFIPVFAVSFLALIWSYFYLNVRPLKWFVVTAIHFLLMLSGCPPKSGPASLGSAVNLPFIFCGWKGLNEEWSKSSSFFSKSFSVLRYSTKPLSCLRALFQLYSMAKIQ